MLRRIALGLVLALLAALPAAAQDLQKGVRLRATAAYEAWLSDMKSCISIAKFEKNPSHQIDGSKGKQK